MKRLTHKEAMAFCKECCEWKNYATIEEYIEDIVVILVHSTWHYTEEQAREICVERRKLIEYYYERKTPADDCACDAGYYCG